MWASLLPAALFLLLAIGEWRRPRHRQGADRLRRWPLHGGLFLANAITGQLLAFIVIVPLAANWAQENNFGLFNLTDWPWWVQAVGAFILLDLAVWLQHLAMHKIPLLWRMHRVHHSDRHLDASSAIRFHPTEIIVSTLYKSAWVAILGVPVVIALAFELWLNVNALFNHSNLRLPLKLDRWLRFFVVTPDMHLVHHSTQKQEQDSNFGFALTIWDRLFKLYRTESAFGVETQPIGLEGMQDARTARFGWSFLLPFRSVN